jgi:isoleucyl-tRNA synthetase
VSVDGVDHALEPDDLTVLRRASGAYAVQEEGGYVVALDPAITPELRAEGVARELVSRVQRLRKEAGLVVSDRIRLAVRGSDEVERAARTHRGYIAGEVLATALLVGDESGAPADAAGNGASNGAGDGARHGSSDRTSGGAPSGAEDALPSAVTRTVDLDGSAVHVTLSKDTI